MVSFMGVYFSGQAAGQMFSFASSKIPYKPASWTQTDAIGFGLISALMIWLRQRFYKSQSSAELLLLVVQAGTNSPRDTRQ
jgi:hypothetical protein